MTAKVRGGVPDLGVRERSREDTGRQGIKALWSAGGDLSGGYGPRIGDCGLWGAEWCHRFLCLAARLRKRPFWAKAFDGKFGDIRCRRRSHFQRHGITTNSIVWSIVRSTLHVGGNGLSALVWFGGSFRDPPRGRLPCSHDERTQRLLGGRRLGRGGKARICQRRGQIEQSMGGPRPLTKLLLHNACGFCQWED